MVMEVDLTMDGGHTMQCMHEILLNCMLENYIILLTNVTPIYFILKSWWILMPMTNCISLVSSVYHPNSCWIFKLFLYLVYHQYMISYFIPYSFIIIIL